VERLRKLETFTELPSEDLALQLEALFLPLLLLLIQAAVAVDQRKAVLLIIHRQDQGRTEFGQAAAVVEQENRLGLDLRMFTAVMAEQEYSLAEVAFSKT
jgi:hypothetical protein